MTSSITSRRWRSSSAFTDEDRELLESMAISLESPPVVQQTRARRSKATSRPATPPADPYRGLARLQEIIAVQRQFPFRVKSGEWKIRHTDYPGHYVRSVVWLDSERTPQPGDAICYSDPWPPRGARHPRSYHFAVVVDVVSTGGVHIVGRPGSIRKFTMTRKELLSGTYCIEGVVENPEAIRWPDSTPGRSEQNGDQR